MNSALVWILVVIGLIVAFAVFKPRARPQYRYSLTPVMSAPEQVLYHRLRAAVGEHNEVLAQVSFSRFLRTKKDQAAFNAISRKTADYVITDRAFNAHTIIELDDKSHDKDADARRDALIESAGLKVIRWNVKALPTAMQIKAAIKGEQQ